MSKATHDEAVITELIEIRYEHSSYQFWISCQQKRLEHWKEARDWRFIFKLSKIDNESIVKLAIRAKQLKFTDKRPRLHRRCFASAKLNLGSSRMEMLA